MGSDDENSGDENPIVARHRKERKELRAKILQAKKAAKSGNKQKQKETNAECEKMEKEQEERHKKELAEQEGVKKEESEGSEEKVDMVDVLVEDEEEKEPESTVYKMTKLSVKQEKRQAKKKAMSEKMAAAAKKDKAQSESQFTDRAREKEELMAILASHKLKMVHIPADGDCMYSALAHQFQLHGIDVDTKLLRKSAAAYMRKHADDFRNFVVMEDAGEHDEGSPWEFYLKSVENMFVDKGAWGGEPELTAIARSFKRAIVIHAPTGEQRVGEQFTVDPPLHVCYLTKAYSLGAHYNSTQRA